MPTCPMPRQARQGTDDGSVRTRREGEECFLTSRRHLPGSQRGGKAQSPEDDGFDTHLSDLQASPVPTPQAAAVLGKIPSVGSGSRG